MQPVGPVEQRVPIPIRRLMDSSYRPQSPDLSSTYAPQSPDLTGLRSHTPDLSVTGEEWTLPKSSKNETKTIAFSSSHATSLASSEASTIISQTSTEAAKLDRLVDFLFVRLSPLYLALAQFEEQGNISNGPCSELVTSITSSYAAHQHTSKNKAPGDDHPSCSKTHLARLLNLVPGLATRCKSIGLVPMAQPPGSETFACPNRARSGPRARTLARIVLTSS